MNLLWRENYSRGLIPSCMFHRGAHLPWCEYNRVLGVWAPSHEEFPGEPRLEIVHACQHNLWSWNLPKRLNEKIRYPGFLQAYKALHYMYINGKYHISTCLWGFCLLISRGHGIRNMWRVTGPNEGLREYVREWRRNSVLEMPIWKMINYLVNLSHWVTKLEMLELERIAFSFAHHLESRTKHYASPFQWSLERIRNKKDWNSLAMDINNTFISFSLIHSICDFANSTTLNETLLSRAKL